MTAARGLNALTKLTMLLTFSVLVLLVPDPAFMLVFVAMVMIAKHFFDTKNLFTRGVVAFGAMIFLAQILFNHAGDTLLRLSFLTITTGGVGSGITISGKFVCLVVMSWIFVATTRPTDLSSALTTAGMPYRYAFLPALAMRYVPTFQFEFASVRDAQTTRGLRLERNFRGLVSSIRYTMVPMLFTAMFKVNSLASSMEGRGFGADSKRTLLHQNRMTLADALIAVSAVALSAIVFLISTQVTVDLFSALPQ
ncbi:MAG: energy-coupling factor transporter transmembrane protein EcfT [Thermoplasmata archaeon]|nr:energy-coupling factor transporter transmembrane protein EcfT [Thermoplasmata archaeon]